MTIKPEHIMRHLNGAIKNKTFYPSGNPAVTSILDKTTTILTEYLETNGKAFVGFMHDTVIFDDMPILDAEAQFPALISHLKEKSVEAMTFEKGFTCKELDLALDILVGDTKISGTDLDIYLKSRGVTKIRIKSIIAENLTSLEIYDGALTAIKDVIGDVRMGKIPKSREIKEIVSELTGSVLSDPNAMLGLTLIKDYDDYLYTHSVNVSLIASAIGKALKLDAEELRTLGLGALLHDIGKTALSEEIIKKPGDLDTGEWEELKSHPVMGSDIVTRMDDIDKTVIKIVYEHHIKHDRSGYPMSESIINPFSSIVTIADTYDALTTLRVYQRPYQPIEAIKLMERFSGKHFDPGILSTFIKLLGLYPIGSIIELSTGDVGIVTAVDEERDNEPIMKVLFNKEGQETIPGERPDIALTPKISFRVIPPDNPVAKKINLNRFFESEASVVNPSIAMH